MIVIEKINHHYIRFVHQIPTINFEKMRKYFFSEGQLKLIGLKANKLIIIKLNHLYVPTITW